MSRRRLTAIFICVFLLGVVVGVTLVYQLAPRGWLPRPRIPIGHAPWSRRAEVADMSLRAIEAGGFPSRNVHVERFGAGEQEGNAFSSMSWKGPTDTKRVIESLGNEMRTFVESNGGIYAGVTRNIGDDPNGTHGVRTFAEIVVNEWVGAFNVWVIRGADDQHVPVVTMHTKK